MIYLSESALKYAVNICEELSNYKVGIVLSSKKKKKKKKNWIYCYASYTRCDNRY